MSDERRSAQNCLEMWLVNCILWRWLDVAVKYRYPIGVLVLGLAAAGIQCSSTTICPHDPPEARYHFILGASDNTGNGHDGVIHGPVPTSDVHGIENSALLFESDSQYVEFPWTLTSKQQAAVTIGARVNLNVTPENNVIYFESTSSSTAARIILSVWSEGTIGFAWRDFVLDGSPQRRYMESQPVIQFQTWHDIVAVLDAVTQTQQIYVDGRLVHADSVRTSNIGDSDPSMIRVGRLTTSTPNYFDGILDELVVYHRALGAAEVRQIFSGLCS